MSELDKTIEAERRKREHELNRYCDGLARGSHLTLAHAKEAFARGEDEVAKSLRAVSREIDRNIQMTQDAKLKEIDRWEHDMRIATRKGIAARKGKR